jgi:hypothetical protein
MKNLHLYFRFLALSLCCLGINTVIQAQLLRPTLSLQSAYAFSENAALDSITLTFLLRGEPNTNISVTLDVLPGLSAERGTDYEFNPLTLTFAPSDTGVRNIKVPFRILNDTVAEPAEYLAIAMMNPVGGNLSNQFFAPIYIIDTDRPKILRTRPGFLNYITGYTLGAPAANSAEMVAYAAAEKQLWVINSVAKRVEIIDFSLPAAPRPLSSQDLSNFGTPTCVAISDKFAAVSVAATDIRRPGKVLIYELATMQRKELTVGFHPDMLCFTPDQQKILVANEAEPAPDYSYDPEGSVSIITLPSTIDSINQSNVINVNFNQFDKDSTILRNRGVRIFGPGATASQDFEPEYITVLDDNKTAFVTLQENNALAVLNLETNNFVEILPLGYKDYTLPGNAFDASDRRSIFTADTSIGNFLPLIARYPVKGMYQPDAIAAFKVNNRSYLITANEGDARNFEDGFSEQTRVGLIGYPLDNSVFPNARFYKDNFVLGRLQVTNQLGDVDADTDFDEIYTFGGRSFSIWNPTTGAQVYDSGDLLEYITAYDRNYRSVFNADHSTNTPRDRSDDKGPEPESVITVNINADTVYAFITLERTGGVMVFDVSNPLRPVLVDYHNPRDLSEDGKGDLGPEGLIFIPAAKSPTQQALLVVANEVSASLSIYQLPIQNPITYAAAVQSPPLKLVAFPNPSKQFEFNYPIAGYLTNSMGAIVLKIEQPLSVIDLSVFPAGLYYFHANSGQVIKMCRPPDLN